MAGEGLEADDLRTVELDDALSGSVASSTWGVRLGALARWRLALWLMSAAGIFAWLATLAPWMMTQVLPFYLSLHLSSTHAIVIPASDPALIELERFVSTHRFPAAGVTLLFVSVELFGAIGLLVGGALFMALRPRLRATLLFVYVAWLVTQVAQAFLATALMASGGFMAAWVGLSRDWKIVSVSPSLGLWFGWLAALLGALGVVLARQAMRADALALSDALGAASASAGGWWQAHAARPRFERWGVVAATVGIGLWAGGFFALPWLTQGCVGLHISFTHFASGSCAGLDSTDALGQSAIFGLVSHAIAQVTVRLSPVGAAQSSVAALTSPGILILPVAALAGWALLALWGDQGGARRYGWLAGWLVLACVEAALAFQGGGYELTHPLILNFSITGPWVYGPGLAMTLVGLAVAGAGMAVARASAGYDASAPTQASSLGVSVSSLSSSRPRPTKSSVGEKM